MYVESSLHQYITLFHGCKALYYVDDPASSPLMDMWAISDLLLLNNATVNNHIRSCMFFHICGGSSSVKILKNKIAGQRVNACVILIDKAKLSSTGMYHYASYQ